MKCLLLRVCGCGSVLIFKGVFGWLPKLLVPKLRLPHQPKLLFSSRPRFGRHRFFSYRFAPPTSRLVCANCGEIVAHFLGAKVAAVPHCGVANGG